MKKYLLLPITFLPLISIISCSNGKEEQKNDYTKLIVKEETIDYLIKRLENKSTFFSDVTEKEFEKEMKKILQEEIILDTESIIYKELEKQNKLEEFKNIYTSEAYDALLEEIKNEKTNTRHWIGFFKWHSWHYITRRLQATSLNLLVVSDIALQLGPSIALFIKTGDTGPLVDSFSSFDGSMSSVTKWLFIKGIENLRKWKIDTRCTSKFYIWGQVL